MDAADRASIEADLQELRRFLSASQRPRVQTVLRRLLEEWQADVAPESIVQVLECSIVVEKQPDTHLGLGLEGTEDGMLRIIDIQEGGLVHQWNCTNPDTVVEPGDLIVEVNDTRGSAAILEAACKEDRELVIKLERWIPSDDPADTDGSGGAHRGVDYTVELDKSAGQSLGMTIKGTEGGSLTITEIVDNGLVAAWNSQRPSGSRVRVGDSIVHVNGVTGDANQIKLEFSKWCMQVIGLRRGRRSRTRAPEWLEFLVQLTKQEEASLGLGLKPFEAGSLLITEVGDGLVQQWNEDHPHCIVRQGDHIVRVNSVSGEAAAMTEELSKTGSVSLMLRRATKGGNNGEFLVTVEKRQTSLGISIKALSDGSLLVTDVQKDGLFGLWNQANPDKQIIPGHRILQVNDARGDAALLKQECAKEGDLKVRVH